MKNNYLLIILLLTFTNSFSQKEKNIWYFGSNAGLDFNSGTPVALTDGAMFTYDNCTSVADENTGSILFYSNGESVWDQNHNVMPNGTGLMGSTSGGNSAFAVRKPGSSTLYYLFTNPTVAGSSGLRYSIIDMAQNGGTGDVTSTKNVILINQATEKITAIKHANNTDIWIITHPWNSNAYNVYLLTSTGLNTTPVVSAIGSIHGGNTSNAMGQISASQSGNKIAVAIYDIGMYELFDFDRNTGLLSNLISISGYTRAWGTEFSPDGNVLYTTQWYGSVSANLHQFDLSSNNQALISNSMTNVGTVTSPDPQYKAGYLQIGPDNKIYVAKFTSSYLGVINSPDNLGNGCNYVDNAIYLGGQLCEAGLPSYMQTSSSTVGLAEHTSSVSNSILIYPNPFSNEAVVEIERPVKNGTLTIVNGIGQTVNYIENINDQKIFINRENLACGLYFIRLIEKEEVVASGRVIIN